MTNNTNLTYSEEQIRQRAYEIYQARGGEEGDEASDWFAAERELKETGKKTRAAARFALNVGLLT